MATFSTRGQNLAINIQHFRLDSSLLINVNEPIFKQAIIFLQRFKRTKRIANSPTSITYSKSFRTWLVENKISCPIAFSDGEDEVRWSHDIMILAATHLGVSLLPIKNTSMGLKNNPAYKMGLKFKNT